MATGSGKRQSPPKPSRARKKLAKRRPAKRSARAQSSRPAKEHKKVDPGSVRLEPGRGSAGRGAGPGGHYWHIYLIETRVGYVYVNALDEAPFGKHASIQIHINQSHRGRGIGSVAYRLACEQSGHDEVIATMRKSNVASQSAAAQAGFRVIDDMKISQLAMRWTRSRQP
jgi:hypothetical protein